MTRGNTAYHRRLNNEMNLSNWSNRNLNNYIWYFEQEYPNFIRNRNKYGNIGPVNNKPYINTSKLWPTFENIGMYNRVKFLRNRSKRNAATKIQKHWRGYKTRQNIRAPNPNKTKNSPNRIFKKVLFMEKQNAKKPRYDPSKHRSRSGLENISRLFS